MNAGEAKKRGVLRAIGYRLWRMLAAFLIIFIGSIVSGGLIGLAAMPGYEFDCAAVAGFFGCFFGVVLCCPVSYLKLARYTCVVSCGTFGFGLLAALPSVEAMPYFAIYMSLLGFFVGNAVAFLGISVKDFE